MRGEGVDLLAQIVAFLGMRSAGIGEFRLKRGFPGSKLLDPGLEAGHGARRFCPRSLNRCSMFRLKGPGQDRDILDPGLMRGAGIGEFRLKCGFPNRKFLDPGLEAGLGARRFCPGSFERGGMLRLEAPVQEFEFLNPTPKRASPDDQGLIFAPLSGQGLLQIMQAG